MIWLPIRITGLSDVIGSWNTIAISVPQSVPQLAAGAAISSRPSKRIEPGAIDVAGRRAGP